MRQSVLTISEFQVAYVRDRTILKNNSIPLQIIRVYNKSQHKSDSGEVITFNDSSESAEFGTSEKGTFQKALSSQTRAFFSLFSLSQLKPVPETVADHYIIPTNTADRL